MVIKLSAKCKQSAYVECSASVKVFSCLYELVQSTFSLLRTLLLPDCSDQCGRIEEMKNRVEDDGRALSVETEQMRAKMDFQVASPV